MANSILNDVKKILGYIEEDTSFDVDLIIFINGVFSTLREIGVGPASGYSIGDKTDTWEDFLGADVKLNSVKSYVYLKVRLLHDPPTTSFYLNAMDQQIKELEWRLNATMEETIWVDPTPETV